MKKFLALLLALVMMLSVVALVACAETEEPNTDPEVVDPVVVTTDAFGLVHTSYVGFATVTYTDGELTGATLDEMCTPLWLSTTTYATYFEEGDAVDYTEFTSNTKYFTTFYVGTDVTFTYGTSTYELADGTTLLEWLAVEANCETYYNAVIAGEVSAETGDTDLVLTADMLQKSLNGYWSTEQGKAEDYWLMYRDATVEYVLANGFDADTFSKNDDGFMTDNNGVVTGATWNDMQDYYDLLKKAAGLYEEPEDLGTVVTSQVELVEALASDATLITITESFELVLDAPLEIGRTLTLAGLDGVTVTVTRSATWTKGDFGNNDNIVVTGNNVVISNIVFDFSDIGTGYGILVGNGGGKWTGSVDTFTLTDCTIIQGSTLSALYVGNSDFTGTLTIDGCTFDGGSVAIYGTDVAAITVTVTNNTFCNTADNASMTNYFWIACKGGTVSADATVTFSGNTLSGKVEFNDTWLGSGVEDNAGVTFVSSNNTMTVTAAEKAVIEDADLADKYVTEGITLVVAE